MAEFVRLDDGRVLYCTDLLRELGFSAHAFAIPGGRLIESVPLNRMAHHAKGHNADSAGIEVVLAGVHDYGSFLEGIRVNRWPDTPQLWAASRWARRALQEYGLDPGAITTHHKLDPDRKLDPGTGFPWQEFLGLVGTA